MPKFILSLFLFFICSGFVLGQTPIDTSTQTLEKFWDLALQNDVEEAQKFVVGSILKNENYAELRKNFRMVYELDLKIGDKTDQQITNQQAYFNFAIKMKGEKFFSGEVMMLVVNKEWKIIWFKISHSKVMVPEPRKFIPIRQKDYFSNPECYKCS